MTRPPFKINIVNKIESMLISRLADWGLITSQLSVIFTEQHCKVVGNFRTILSFTKFI